MVMVNTQRPAIEDAIEGLDALTPLQQQSIWEKKLFLDGGAHLGILGMSLGEGMYSRMQGVHILGVGFLAPHKEIKPRQREFQHVILLRMATQEECVEYNGRGGENFNSALKCVEALTIAEEDPQRIIFSRPEGRKIIYVVIL